MADEPSRAVYQHALTLAQLGHLTILSVAGAPFPRAISEVADVRRFTPVSFRLPKDIDGSRWTGAAVWAARRVEGATRNVMFAVWCLLRIAPDRRARPIVVTLWDYYAVIGRLAKLAGARWVADVTDSPEHLIEDVEALRVSKSRFDRCDYRLARFHFDRLFRMRRLFSRADCVLVTSTELASGLAAQMTELYAVRPARIVLVPNGVWPNAFTRWRSIESSDNTICFIGASLAPSRGLAVLTDAMRSIIASIPEAHLLLVGPTASPVADFENELAGHVTAFGQLRHDEAMAVVAGATVVVCPFPTSPVLDGVMPIRLLEAIALGKPVVASRLDGIAQVVRDGREGILVPPGDADALARAIVALLGDPVRRHAMTRAALDRAQELSWDRSLDCLRGAVTRLDRLTPVD